MGDFSASFDTTTTGINITFDGPPLSSCLLDVSIPITNAVASSVMHKHFGSGTTGTAISTGVGAVATDHVAFVRGVVRAGSQAGTFKISFASEVNGSMVTVYPTSFMRLLKVA